MGSSSNSTYKITTTRTIQDESLNLPHIDDDYPDHVRSSVRIWTGQKQRIFRKQRIWRKWIRIWRKQIWIWRRQGRREQIWSDTKLHQWKLSTKQPECQLQQRIRRKRIRFQRRWK